MPSSGREDKAACVHVGPSSHFTQCKAQAFPGHVCSQWLGFKPCPLGSLAMDPGSHIGSRASVFSPVSGGDEIDATKASAVGRIPELIHIQAEELHVQRPCGTQGNTASPGLRGPASNYRAQREWV